MAHGELLAPAIRDAMGQAGAVMDDLTDVAVGVGPGPFTGLRVGVVTALTLGSTLGLAQHGVCSLDIVAFDVTDRAATHAAIAALQHPELPTYGRGGELYDGVLRPAGKAQDPRAAALASAVIAGRVVEMPLEPLYLRRPDAVPQIVNPRA